MKDKAYNFKSLIVYSNWCYIDQLDGRDLVDGEKLIVRWPNGKTQTKLINVVKSTFYCQDHGSTFLSKDHYALMVVTINDVDIKIKLRDYKELVFARA